jgi:CotS family spore coat protein
LDIEELKLSIEKAYGLNVVSAEKIKNVYKIKTKQADYCLKMIKYNFSHFWFILSAIKHIQNNGFDKVPDILKEIHGADYIKIDNYNAYLTKWIAARECNYDNPLDLAKASVKLAELHDKSQGFCVTDKMQPRVYWYKWPENFKTRKEEILDFKMKIELKEKHSEFDYLYLSNMEQELKKADNSTENLLKTFYLEKVKKDEAKKGFCHHDYAHHNVLIEDTGVVNIIDFDYCILDSNLHDLASLLLRRMKNGKWDIDNATYILNNYSLVKKVDEKDIPIMSAFMEFPHDYWQVGIQYYWEKQPWGEDFYIKKLKKIYEDNEEKQDFIDDFRFLKYKS